MGLEKTYRVLTTTISQKADLGQIHLQHQGFTLVQHFTFTN